MTKKLFLQTGLVLIITTVLLFVFFTQANFVSAQGTFSCKWRNDKCEAGAGRCDDPSYKPDNQVCKDISTERACERIKDVTCIKLPGGTTPPGGTTTGGGGLTSLPNPLQAKSIWDLINRLITVLAFFAVPLYVLMVLYTGFLYMTAGGNMHKAGKAKKVFLYATVGFIIIILGRAVAAIVQGILTGDSNQDVIIM